MPLVDTSYFMLSTSEIAEAESMGRRREDSSCSIEFSVDYANAELVPSENGGDQDLVFMVSSDSIDTETFTVSVTAYGDGETTSTNR